MNSVAEDVANMLVAESSLDLVLGTNLHLYREPAKPNNTVTIFEVPGMPPVGLLSSNEDSSHYERPAIQIRIRNNEPEAAFELAYTIIHLLQARCHETWGNYYYSVIYSTSNPTMLDWDASNRVRIVLNFNIQRRLLAGVLLALLTITNLVASPTVGDNILVQWDYVNFNSSTIIERSEDNLDYTVITTVGVNVNSYVDTDVVVDVYYYYRVRSSRGTYYSGYSFTTVINPPVSESDYLIMEFASTQFRKGIREIEGVNHFVTDKTKTATGFDGVEDTDWENIRIAVI